MNDYERLAERLAEIEQRLDTIISETDDEDILAVLQNVAGRIEGVRALAEGRS